MKVQEITEVVRCEVTEVVRGDVFQYTVDVGSIPKGAMMVLEDSSIDKSNYALLDIMRYDGVGKCAVTLKFISEQYNKGSLKYLGNINGAVE